MATYLVCKRAGQLGTKIISGYRRFIVSPLESMRNREFDCRQISQLVKYNEKQLFFLDTLALVRRFEALGVPSKQAEEITASITEVLNDSLENVAQSFVSKEKVQMTEMTLESKLSEFKSEFKSSQECHYSMLQLETEKLWHETEKMYNDLRFEIDKVTTEQRLDLKLERESIRKELTEHNTTTNDLTNKLVREIQNLRVQLEASKFELLKYCMGALASVSAAGLAVMIIWT